MYMYIYHILLTIELFMATFKLYLIFVWHEYLSTEVGKGRNANFHAYQLKLYGQTDQKTDREIGQGWIDKQIDKRTQPIMKLPTHNQSLADI